MWMDAEELLGTAPAPLGVTRGPDHVVVRLNPAAQRLLVGRDVTGRPLREVLPGSGSGLLAAMDRAYREDTAVPAVPWQGPGGRCTVGCSPVHDGSGAVAGVLLAAEPAPTPSGTAAAGDSALQRLAQELSRAATPSSIGALLVEGATELLGADAASVYASTGSQAGGPEILEIVHSRGWPAGLERAYRQVRVQPGRPLSDTVLSGTPVWLEDADQWHARYPEMAPVHSAGGYRATACLPLQVHERCLGAVVLSFVAPRAFRPEEREFLQAVAALCAQAMGRARLLVLERDARAGAERQRDRMAFLAEAARLMDAPLSVERRLRRLADLAVPTVADWCAVHLVRGDRVEQVAVAHTDPDKVVFVARLQERYPPDPDSPGGAIGVARSGVATLVAQIEDSMLAAAARDATHLELLLAIGMRSYIVVPLLVRGVSLGALTLVSAESGRVFDDTDLAFARQLAAGAAVALDNARLYEQQRHVARTLQTALLPAALPDAPGLRLAGRYRAQSSDAVYVGGDLYDVVEGGAADRWAVLVGDVCGKGPEAAALTALIRHTVRAEVGHGLGPAQVLHRLNAAMLRHAGPGSLRFATVAHGQLRVDDEGVSISLVSAGHLPALVLRGDGVQTVRAPGTLLGVYPDLDLTQVEVRLGPGEQLVLHTDGITEARGPAGFYGAARLESLLAACAGLPAPEVADALMADVVAFGDGVLHDDVAVLVVEAAPEGRVPGSGAADGVAR